jgi:UDP:flavonoid glycosyltransferase YjiC (YdhE family)
MDKRQREKTLMSRFLFATIGSLGDLHPYIAVARALIARGHQAVIATTEDYRAAVEGAGVEFSPIRPSMAELGDFRTLAVKLFDVYHGPEYLIRRLIMANVGLAYEHLSQAVKGADLLISHPLTFALPLVAQKQGLPWVATVLSPLSFMSCYDPPVLAGAAWLRKLRVLGPGPYKAMFSIAKRLVARWESPLRELRKRVGLPSTKKMALFEGQFSPLGNLALFDTFLAEPQPDWPAHVRVCGAPVYDGLIPDARVNDDLEKFLAEGEPPIVFALGSSAVWVAGDFWIQAIAAATQLKYRALLITGPFMPENLPEGIRAFSYLPYSQVFSKAAAIVHQGGIGTLSQSLRSGAPQLIVPVAFDQPDNARRTVALGLARSIPFKKITANRLTSELRTLLAHDEYSHAARKTAEYLAVINGAACAADELIGCDLAQKGRAEDKT